MKKKIKEKIILFLSLFIILTLVFAVFSTADFGDFGGDIDFGGDSDWGDSWGDDSDWSGGSGGSYSGFDSGFILWLVLSLISFVICLSIIPKAKNASSSGSRYLYIVLAVIFGLGANLLAILFIKAIINAINGNNMSAPATVQTEQMQIQDNLISVDEFKEEDPYFNENSVREYISNFYIKHQNARMNGDFTILSPYCTQSFFDSVSDDSNRIQIINPTVLSSTVLGFERGSSDDYMYILLTARQKQPDETFVNIKYTLKRSSSVLTKNPALITKIVCPNCGAPVDEAFSSKCTYCDSVIDIDPTGWKISDSVFVSNNFIKPSGTNGNRISVSEYTALNGDFNQTEFCNNIASLYVTMQEDWGKRNIMPLQKYFTDVYFKQMNQQVQGHIDAGRYPHCEDINVQSVEPLYFTENLGSIGVTVRVVASIRAYYTNFSGKIISGNKNRKTMTYEWDLIKRHGEGVSESLFCPGCGAELSHNASETCSYCGSVIRKLPDDWAISTIRAISQVTG